MLGLLVVGLLGSALTFSGWAEGSKRMGPAAILAKANGVLAIGDPTANEIDVIGAGGVARTLVRYGASPAWSPDGTKLAYVGSPATGNPSLYLANAAGRDRRRLPVTFQVDYETGSDVSWSPDGRRLVFDGGPGGDDHIYVIDADGTGLRQLTHGHEDTAPAWSPDGNTIAFVRGVSTFEIYLMNTHGGDQRKLTAGDDPAWSPHGTFLAFDRGGGAYSGGSGGLYAIAPGHGGAERLGNGTAPSWSPDGKQLAFFCCSGYAAQANGIYAVSINGGRPRRLAAYTAGPVSLSWQPRP